MPAPSWDGPPGHGRLVFAFGIRDAEWRAGVSIDVADGAQLFKAKQLR